MLEPQEMGLPESYQSPFVKNLTKTAIKIYTTLVEVAYDVSERRGYKASPNQVTFFCPAEIIAYALGIGRTTLYRHLTCLRESGLIDQRGHYTSCNGQTRADGSLWAVNMKPDITKAAKLHHDDLHSQYRNLAEDIDNKRTAYAAIQEMKQSNKPTKDIQGKELILKFIPLPPTNKESTLSLTVPPSESADIAAVLDIPEVHRNDRNQAVAYAGYQCALYLNDLANVTFYRWLLWQALRLYWQDQDCFASLQTMLMQVQREKEDFRKPGAVFVKRLKASMWWEQLRNVPMVRVGVAPESPVIAMKDHLCSAA